MSDRLQKKIAIIGTGISGLTAGSLLHPYHNLTIYEKNDYIGGHSRTVEVQIKNKIVAVDTGFIVFNKRNYPLLTRLFEHLQVPVNKSDMSFGASINDGWLEYGTKKPSNIFAQKIHLLRPAFWGMVADILKFNAKAGDYLAKDPSFTLADCLDALKMGPWFRQYFLLAMGGAIWSTPVSEMLKFPACSFIRFFENHGLLSINDHPTWYTVKGGSREYVRRLTEPYKDAIFTNRGVKKVWRQENMAIIEDNGGKTEAFNDVIFACHADQALCLMQDPSANEQAILSAFRYQENLAVLHADIRLMPKCKKAWASWVYLSEGKADNNPKISLSYWMNNLQPLQTSEPLILTLNPGREPDPSKVFNEYTFEHPVFDEAAIRNQHKIDDIQGINRYWFCGAYQKYGFHEDGLTSAVNIAKKMGVAPPW